MTKKRVNPKSLENLTHEGRPTTHGEKKVTHNISVTPTGWSGVLNIARAFGVSVSELIEQVGRQKLKVDQNLQPPVSDSEKMKLVKDAAAQAAMLQETLQELVNLADSGADRSE
jgi:hypothetical protein